MYKIIAINRNTMVAYTSSVLMENYTATYVVNRLRKERSQYEYYIQKYNNNVGLALQEAMA